MVWRRKVFKIIQEIEREKMTILLKGDCLVEMDKIIEQGIKVDAIIKR